MDILLVKREGVVIRLINLYSNSSKLLLVHPLEKLTFMLASLIVCSYTESLELIIINIAILIIVNLIARNPWEMLNKFIFISLVFSISTSVSMLWQQQPYELIYLVILRGINGAITIAFFSLTTPINHLVYIMSKSSITRDIGDIIKSMERFIILLEDDIKITFVAIRSRGGFAGCSNSIKDYGRGFSIVFKNLFMRWREIQLALDNRCYSGKLSYIESFKYNWLSIICISTYILLLVGGMYFLH